MKEEGTIGTVFRITADIRQRYRQNLPMTTERAKTGRNIDRKALSSQERPLQPRTASGEAVSAASKRGDKHMRAVHTSSTVLKKEEETLMGTSLIIPDGPSFGKRKSRSGDCAIQQSETLLSAVSILHEKAAGTP